MFFCLALSGCSATPKPTEIERPDFTDTTPDAVSLSALRDELRTKDETIEAKERALRLAIDEKLRLDRERAAIAMQRDQANAEADLIWGEKQSAIRNAEAAQIAKARNERTWMFTMIGSGILLLLGGGAIAVIGFKTPTQHTTKVGGFVAIVGIGFILIAPHGAAVAKPVLFGAYALFGTMALGAAFWMVNNLYYDWLDRRKK